MERTLTIIKPDSVKAGNTGKILAHLEAEGFRIVAMRMTHLSREQAGAFYEVHKERPFYDELVDFMTSGPCVPAVLERHDAVVYLRQVMGATNPEEAGEGTIRKLYGTDVGSNAIHGSDSPENSVIEQEFFFPRCDRL